MLMKRLKDPGSAITHFIGMLMAIFAAVPLLIKAAHEPGPIYIISISVYTGLWHFNYIKTSTKCRNALFFCQILYFILE